MFVGRCTPRYVALRRWLRGCRTLVSERTAAAVESYDKVTDEDVAVFRSLISDRDGVLHDPSGETLTGYTTDYMLKHRGESTVVLRPRNTAEVSDILAHCNSRKIAVVPQGGNTGLVIGGVPLGKEVILSLTRMNQVMNMDEHTGLLTVQGGAVLEDVERHVNSHGFVFPLDLGAKGTAQIGGNIATNAGGLRFLKYGSLHGSVVGLEVVLADGTILGGRGALHRDGAGPRHASMGWPLQLFCGSEGTLGVITAATIRVQPRPIYQHVAFLACPDFESVVRTFGTAQEKFGEVLTAFEFLDAGSKEMVLSQLHGTRDPLGGNREPSPYYAMVETSGCHLDHDYTKLTSFLEMAMEMGDVADGVVVGEPRAAKELWRIREGIPPALRRRGAVYKYDLSMNVHDMPRLVDAVRQRVEGMREVQVVAFGHLGDGNLHLNISAPDYKDEIHNLLEPFVYEWTAQRSGSVSAEHGLGAMKACYIHHSKNITSIDLMKRIKLALDPRGILNPGKVLYSPVGLYGACSQQEILKPDEKGVGDTPKVLTSTAANAI